MLILISDIRLSPHLLHGGGKMIDLGTRYSGEFIYVPSYLYTKVNRDNNEKIKLWSFSMPSYCV